ncbi:putative transcriptional regulator, BolA superfamily [secondary endosymbiont of Heteropsylla cubana]|uniref:Putative transcriptional regulator, BolA superfamily n=1 Tax=secondary endosymbiont of Heteropsylla cubana TaxID=134287 RepID=J3Z5N6_9ENTR|nr:BolA family protein [secondary endosymbiont of Heteropsylla cubana]AFP85654.1 putative transcriptional regulator, BolA superfamily [secondary endosymbiont of Heteropsylla cubana]
MDKSEIKLILMKALVLDEVHVSGNGNHFHVIAVSEQFNGMSEVKKQKIIYAPLVKYILDNRIHALTIKACTPNEWKGDSNNRNSF